MKTATYCYIRRLFIKKKLPLFIKKILCTSLEKNPTSNINNYKKNQFLEMSLQRVKLQTQTDFSSNFRPPAQTCSVTIADKEGCGSEKNSTKGFYMNKNVD